GCGGEGVQVTWVDASVGACGGAVEVVRHGWFPFSFVPGELFCSRRAAGAWAKTSTNGECRYGAFLSRRNRLWSPRSGGGGLPGAACLSNCAAGSGLVPSRLMAGAVDRVQARRPANRRPGRACGRG